MGCSSCGTDGGGCSSGCGKLDVHDWLGDMSQPMSGFDAVEVRFKGGRKEFFRNVHNLELYTGDIIVVESSPGHHVGEVTMQGEIVRLQLKKKKIKYNDDLPIIYRKATAKDVEKFEQARNRELPTLYRTREVVRELKLNMKMSDIEYQADNSKATFYYSAEERVDFRELIKLLATENKIRVEMKQISLRQEASRLGGIGSCGRELCCSTWLTDFKNVSTSAARYQNLSLNPAKLSGQCGRLKCCLNYELETYISSSKEMPEVKGPLKTESGVAFLQKSDIFKKQMWFAYANDTNWIMLSAERVTEILKLNADGQKVHSLYIDIEEEIEEGPINDDLLALDKRLSKKNPNASKGKKKGKQVKKQEPRNKRQDVRAKSQEPKAPKQEPRNKAKGTKQEPKAKTQVNKPQNKDNSNQQKQDIPKANKPSGAVRKRQNVNSEAKAKPEPKQRKPEQKAKNQAPRAKNQDAKKAEATQKKNPPVKKAAPSGKIRKRQNAVGNEKSNNSES